ncbi:MAG: MoaD/ThiS family protein [Deltaproteobacteria bacterium]|nr:MoaD/ThiS family protein [Deltaproteobacteria bacterium]
MSIKAHIHKTHRQFTNGLEVVEVDGNTVGECLNYLVKQFPGIEKELFNKNGKLRNIVEIYVNLESTYPDELAKAVVDGDEIHVTFILAGG